MNETTPQARSDPAARRTRRNEILVSVLLVGCLVLVGAWEFLAKRSRRPLDPFDITYKDFKTFSLAGAGWTVRPLPVYENPIEPNILAYAVERAAGSAAGDAWRGTILVRLVHGYNMPDCMRIKGYAVTNVLDARAGSPRWGGRRLQVWRLTAESESPSLWVTSMIRVGDFAETDVDVRSMAFPRVGVPDDPNWVPRGFRLSSLRHPIRNFRILMRSKWNTARCDLATFLKLRQPAWASEDLLTLVASTQGPPLQPGDEEAALAEAEAAHAFVYAALRDWRAAELARIESGAPPAVPRAP